MQEIKNVFAWIGFAVVLFCTLAGALDLLNSVYIAHQPTSEARDDN